MDFHISKGHRIQEQKIVRDHRPAEFLKPNVFIRTQASCSRMQDGGFDLNLFTNNYHFYRCFSLNILIYLMEAINLKV